MRTAHVFVMALVPVAAFFPALEHSKPSELKWRLLP